MKNFTEYITPEFSDELIKTELKWHYDYALEQISDYELKKSYVHPEDYAYALQLKVHLGFVLEHYGVQV